MRENTLSKVALNQTLNTTSTSTLEEFTQYLPLSNERPHAIRTNSIQTKDFIMCGCVEYLYSEYEAPLKQKPYQNCFHVKNKLLSNPSLC